MKHLWDKDFWYGFLRPYVDWCTRASYSRLKVQGRENIPDDGAVIYAPNHCNTLMDAVVVLQAHKGPKIFGCRADLFNNPTAARLLRFLKIVPIARQRDGLQKVAENFQVFEEVVESMGKDVPFCLFVEGTHRTKRSLLPMRKGVFRLAARAHKAIDKPVYIVPVGLEYDDYFKYMRPVTMTFGKPINVSEFIESHPEVAETELSAHLAPILHDRLAGLITYFPDDENYDSAYAAWEAARKPVSKWWEWPLAVVLLPFFAASGALCLPMWLTSLILGGKAKDKAWLNTIRFVTKFAWLPILFIVYAVLGFTLLPWYWAIVLLVALIWSHSVFFLILNLYKKLINK